MSSAKKYQVFISSTYTDLLDERQAAVEAILQAGHIPAGMELFTSSNQSQWDIIKRWIDESDIYMLILGGRYGSIETKSGKSYTHLEYEYALSIKKPLFVMVIKDEALSQKTVAQVENENPEKLKKFKKKVLSSMCEFFIDTKDIQLNVHKCLGKIIQDNELVGWVHGNQQNEGLASELVRLNEENRKLREENEEFKRNQQIRLPKLTLEINDSEPLVLKYQEYKALFYKNREAIDWTTVDNELKQFLTLEEVEKYNEQLSTITQDKIKKFNKLRSLLGNLENNPYPITMKLSNSGNLKAQQLYITIQFPDFIYVEEQHRTEDRLGLIKKNEQIINNLIPNPTWNPLQEANEKLQKEIFRKSNPWSSMGLVRNAVQASTLQPRIHDHLINLKRINNPDSNYEYLKDNCITIERGNLLHRLSKEYDDYCIYPLERGKGNIIVKLHCEEYSTDEVIEVPIIVE